MDVEVTLPAAVVVICTRNRPAELSRCLEMLLAQTVQLPVLIVDSSRDGTTRGVVADVAEHESLDLTYLSSSPGLARQRNVALDRLRSSLAPCEVVCFLDDDTVFGPTYVESLLARFATTRAPEVGGVAPVVHDKKSRPVGLLAGIWNLLKRLFLLHGRQGAVLRSGRHVMVRQIDEELETDWLPGVVAYRMEVFDRERFDDRLVGYSWGEDLDLSFRASQHHRLVVLPHVHITNVLAPSERLVAKRLARLRTILLHAWVREQRHRGLSLAAFWWSVAGEIFLQAVLGTVLRRREARHVAVGTVLGVTDIVRHGSRRDVDPDQL